MWPSGCSRCRRSRTGFRRASRHGSPEKRGGIAPRKTRRAGDDAAYGCRPEGIAICNDWPETAWLSAHPSGSATFSAL
jgi:hypothetical protein